MADYHGGKRKRQDDGADAPPNKHQRTEAVPDYTAHTYAEADPNAYYDYSAYYAQAAADGTYDPNAYWTPEQYANYQWPANYYAAPAVPQGYNPAVAFANNAAKTNKVSTPAVKQKGHLRKAGDQVWEDPTLADWSETDYRIFVGDLGNDVSDNALYQAFSQYKSISKARVVRDNKTTKTKGYGFVSFSDPQDFLRVLKEMNGKYIGNRPCKIRRSEWKDRSVADSEVKQVAKEMHNKNKKKKK